MKNRQILLILACILAASFAFGVTGTVAFAKKETAETDGAGKDRLVGVWITTEHLDLFDWESYLADNAGKIFSDGEISASESAPYQGRLYAALVDASYTDPETGVTVTTQSYEFEGIDGICYFAAQYPDANGVHWGTGGDEAISDRDFALTCTDAGDSIDLTGTIYVSTSKGADEFYFNPVYQTSDGAIYATAGNGMSYGGDLAAGMSGSLTLQDEQTVTVDGKSETVSTKVEVSVCYMDTPTDTQILQFDENGKIVSTQRHAPGDLPGTITAERDAAYMIVETQMESADGTQTTARELFQPEDESLFAFFCREDGICVKRSCAIVWEGDS